MPAVDEEAYAASQKENEERARASVEAQKDEWARWSNSEDTTLMWQIVSSGESAPELEAWLKRAPGLIHLRAEDGRGPLWWAYEYDRPDMVALLVREGADPDATDPRHGAARDGALGLVMSASPHIPRASNEPESRCPSHDALRCWDSWARAPVGDMLKTP